ncbi:MAG: DUF2877 domain-containing protein [Burkholderiaceae bacterium]
MSRSQLHSRLTVHTLGYLVPRTAFSGRVHSVFEHACNLECDWGVGRGLLTLCDGAAAIGPTTLHFASDDGVDLRDGFFIGDAVMCRDDTLRIGRIELGFPHARIWQPPVMRARQAGVEARCHRAGVQLAARRRLRSSVIDAQAAPVVAALADACRNLDTPAALAQAQRLIGWGEGLTPAGDDFLVGLLAALQALARSDAPRLGFHAVLAMHVARDVQRTTPIAAHYLRLAAAGHFTEPLLSLRDALLGQTDEAQLDAALQRALAVGATSGADTVSGFLAGLTAWISPCAAPTMAL